MSEFNKISNAKELGQAIRKKRKLLGVRIDQAALMIGIAKDTLSKIENGSSGVSLGKVFLTMNELGLKFFVENDIDE